MDPREYKGWKKNHERSFKEALRMTEERHILLNDMVNEAIGGLENAIDEIGGTLDAMACVHERMLGPSVEKKSDGKDKVPRTESIRGRIAYLIGLISEVRALNSMNREIVEMVKTEIMDDKRVMKE